MKINLENQYDKMQCYLMVYPCNFDITDSSNKYKGKVNKIKVFKQYNDFVNLIIDQGIKIQFLDIVNNSTNQIFVRDVGFVVKDIFFVSKPKTPERYREIAPLLNFIKKYELKYHVMQNYIEGGDVIHYDDFLFIGIGGRTNNEAIVELQKVLDDNNIDVKVVPIKFDINKVHLDCTFNTLDRESCIITDYVYDVDIIKKYIKNCIKLEKNEADELGSNYIYLGDRKIITNSEGTRKLLNSKGFEAYYTDFSEIIKAKGSLGCSTLPILRST